MQTAVGPGLVTAFNEGQSDLIDSVCTDNLFG